MPSDGTGPSGILILPTRPWRSRFLSLWAQALAPLADDLINKLKKQAAEFVQDVSEEEVPTV